MKNLRANTAHTSEMNDKYAEIQGGASKGQIQSQTFQDSFTAVPGLPNMSHPKRNVEQAQQKLQQSKASKKVPVNTHGTFPGSPQLGNKLMDTLTKMSSRIDNMNRTVTSEVRKMNMTMVNDSNRNKTLLDTIDGQKGNLTKALMAQKRTPANSGIGDGLNQTALSYSRNGDP